MTNEQHFKRWLLIVRERLADEGIRFDRRFDWRAQYDDGQRPQAAIAAYKASNNIH